MVPQWRQPGVWIGAGVVLVAAVAVLWRWSSRDPDADADHQARAAFAQRREGGADSGIHVVQGVIDPASMIRFYWSVRGPIIDARDTERYVSGWIPRALDGTQALDQLVDQLPKAKDRLFVVYGRDDQDRRPAELIARLATLGYRQGCILGGGFPAWVQAHQPIEGQRR